MTEQLRCLLVDVAADEFALLVADEVTAITEDVSLDPVVFHSVLVSVGDNELHLLQFKNLAVLGRYVNDLARGLDDLCHSSYFLKILRLSGFRFMGGIVYHLKDKNRLERIKTNYSMVP